MNSSFHAVMATINIAINNPLPDGKIALPIDVVIALRNCGQVCLAYNNILLCQAAVQNLEACDK